MMRASAVPHPPTSSSSFSGRGRVPRNRSLPLRSNSSSKHNSKDHYAAKYIIQCLVVCAGLWLVIVFHSHDRIIHNTASTVQPKTTTRTTGGGGGGGDSKSSNVIRQPPPPPPPQMPNFVGKIPRKTKKVRKLRPFPGGFLPLLQRAKAKRDYCQNAQFQFTGFDESYEVLFGKQNQTLATLPTFGIIKALDNWRTEARDQKPLEDWQCQLPPETECGETQVTAVFMAYNPDRLDKMFFQIKKMLSRDNFQGLIQECVIVWNGPRDINESAVGRQVLEFASQPDNALRIVYPLKIGFPNDLMNRYHPYIVNVTTKAILYYDDDGPFYSFKAIEAGFELWKRNAKAQIGAMARQINYSPRQQQEYSTNVDVDQHSQQQQQLQHDDRNFISHCDNLHDKVEYNFHYFANYNANMVLPSGSMLHVNYLCFLWHPALQEVRQFVLDHPVHPDDITVSTVVSHLGGRAPRVYSRRLNPDESKNAVPVLSAVSKTRQRQRRLSEEQADAEQREEVKDAEKPKEKNRAGIGGICWDCGQGMTEKKQIWADLRSQAINTLIRYFGSINSGSIGWCENTPYYNPNKADGKCEPIMAKQGWLPWMNPDGSPKDTCP